VRGAGGDIKHTYTLVNAIAASLPSGAVAALQNRPNVVRVEADLEVHAIDAELDSVWGVDRVDAEVVHNTQAPKLAGAGVKVAVIDSGIDLTHPDLIIASSVNFAKGKSADDKYGHGTHVAGTIAGLDDGNGVVGVAPGASLYAVRVLGNSGSGRWSDVIAGIEWASGLKRWHAGRCDQQESRRRRRPGGA